MLLDTELEKLVQNWMLKLEEICSSATISGEYDVVCCLLGRSFTNAQREVFLIGTTMHLAENREDKSNCIVQIKARTELIPKHNTKNPPN